MSITEQIVNTANNIKNMILYVKFNINDKHETVLEFREGKDSGGISLYNLTMDDRHIYEVANFFKEILVLPNQRKANGVEYWLLLDSNEETLKTLLEWEALTIEELSLYFKLGGL